MNDRQKEIHNHINDLKNKRREYMISVMKEFDEEQDKIRNSLQEECGKIGHYSNSYYYNGLGYRWKYCHYCGDRFDVEDLVINE